MVIKKQVFMLLLLLFFGGSFGVAEDLEVGSALITATIGNFNAQIGNLHLNPQNKKEIIRGFCQTLSAETTTGFSTQEERYDASQSLFLFVLCNNYGLKTPFFREQLSTMLKTNALNTLKVAPTCRKDYLEECNIVQLGQRFMSQLFSELFTMKQAEIFGLSQVNLLDKTSLTQKMNNFAKEKFGIDGFCTNKGHHYPKTCANFQNMMKTFVPKIAQFKIINASQLQQLVKGKGANESLEQCRGIPDYDFLLCGTRGESTAGMKPFITLLYNELARYTIFMTYYTSMLNTRDSIDFSIRDEIAQYAEDQTMMFVVTNQSLNDLLAFSRNYPLHIGLLAYQEDLLRLRDKSISKLITPFYTLYHKLRNAQTNQ